jgi:hypothetical protein
MKPYPCQICTPCAEENKAKWPNGHVAGFWTGKCDVCEKEMAVTAMRDWRFPDIEGHEKPERLSEEEYLIRIYESIPKLK